MKRKYARIVAGLAIAFGMIADFSGLLAAGPAVTSKQSTIVPVANEDDITVCE